MSLSFLHVLVERIVDGGFVTSVQYIVSQLSLACVVYRIKLSDELELFVRNGYPIGIVTSLHREVV